MKSYNAPKLVAKGSVIELTQGAVPGNVDGGVQDLFPSGSIGFNLGPTFSHTRRRIMKTYKTPTLVAKGDVVALTQGMIPGTTDPDGITDRTSVGSVGFGL
jgi:hypothetical protein